MILSAPSPAGCRGGSGRASSVPPYSHPRKIITIIMCRGMVIAGLTVACKRSVKASLEIKNTKRAAGSVAGRLSFETC